MRRLLQSAGSYLVAQGRDLVLPLAFLVSGIVFQNLAYYMPWLVVYFYSRQIFPRLLAAFSYLSRGFGFSLGEVLVSLTLSLAFVFALFFFAGLLRRRGERRGWVLKWARYGLWVAAGSFWCFLLMFGLNSQRPPLFELLGYE